MFCVWYQAHLSPFSLVEASFQPSWTEKKLSGSVTASAYSWPTTMLQLSKMPLPKELLCAFTLCSPQPTATQSVFSHGMNAYSMRYGLPSPSMLVVWVWYPQYTGWPVAIGRGGVRITYVAYGSYLKWAEARMASIAIGSSTRFWDSPDAMMSSGTGVGSVQTPFSWLLGFVMNCAPAIPVQLVVPAGTLRQYCVCTPA